MPIWLKCTNIKDFPKELYTLYKKQANTLKNKQPVTFYISLMLLFIIIWPITYQMKQKQLKKKKKALINNGIKVNS